MQCNNKELQTINAKLTNDVNAMYPQIDQRVQDIVRTKINPLMRESFT